MKPKTVSLVDELAALGDALESAEMLAEMMVNGALPDLDDQARAPRMLAAVLGMAKGRIELLRKVVLGQAESGLLVGRHNFRISPVHAHEDPDIILGVDAKKPKRR